MDKLRKEHWENIYNTKQPQEVSWTQENPKTSLDLIRSFNLPTTAKIIDIGGGDSNLVDHLLDEGYGNITVLDISEAALQKAKDRLGERADKINWIVTDINDFKPEITYDLWHDRAAFHFLTKEKQIIGYQNTLKKAASKYLIIGTFSENGPLKCSNLEVKRYNESELTDLLSKDFEKLKCLKENHKTPFNTFQNFLFCSFKKEVKRIDKINMDPLFEKILEKKNVRPTAMRLLVLEKLYEQQAAISLSILENSFENSDRITLYRTLKTFQEKGLVHSIDDGTGAPKYALCEDGCKCDIEKDMHVHFHCRMCNETFCLPKYKIPEISLPEKFTPEEANLVVKGVCVKCS